MVKHLSLSAFVVISIAVVLIGFLFYPKWEIKGTESMLSWDAAGYYAYLPAAFIYHDLKDMKKTEQKAQEHTSGFEAFYAPNGHKITKYAVGQAVLFAPAFFIAHMLAPSFGYPADGFSYPYQLAIGLWGLFVNILGFWFLRKLLIRHFKDGAVAIVLMVIYFGTNYLNQNTIESAYAHNHLFTLYAVLLLLTEKYYQQPQKRTIFWIGLTVGMMTLIRPTELIAILIPMFWFVGSRVELVKRLHFLRSKFLHIVLAGLVIVLIGFIQLSYWKYSTGHWIYYSYGDQGFDFLQPHFYNCIFTYKKGWWVYTPVMSLIVPGFVILFRRKSLFYPVFIYSFLFMYIVFSWQVWWYGGSMSQRSVVQLYVLLAIPLTALAENVLATKKYWVKGLFLGFVLFSVYYNFWLTYQAHYGGQLHPDRMNRYYFRKVFLRSKSNINHKALLDNKDYFDGIIPAPKEIFFTDFEQDTLGLCPDSPLSGNKSFWVHKNGPQFQSIRLAVPKDKKWLRASFTGQLRPKEWNEWAATQFVLTYKLQGKTIKTNLIRVDNLFKGNEIKTINLDSKIPKKPFDDVILSFLLYSQDGGVVVDDLKVVVFDE